MNEERLRELLGDLWSNGYDAGSSGDGVAQDFTGEKERLTLEVLALFRNDREQES